MNVFKSENGLLDNPSDINSYEVQRDNLNRQENRSRLIKNIIMKEGEPGPPQRVMSTIAQGSPMRAV